MSATDLSLLSPAILDERLKREKDYWLEKLSGSIAAACLPLDYRRPDTFSDEKHSTVLLIDPETQRKLLTICEHKELLVFAALVTAVKICLYKYTGIEEVSVGSTIHERYKELASLNKVLVLHDRVEGAMTGRELLLNVKRTISEAYLNQKYPFKRLVELLSAGSVDSYEPLFNVTAIMSNFNNRENIGDLKSDINLIFTMEEGSVTGVIESNSNLFAKESVEKFAEHLNEVLGQLINYPDRRIAELRLVSAETQRQWIADFNDTRAEYPLSSCIHHLFEAQVRRTPNAVAARTASRLLTFAELDQQANQLAHFIIESGIRPQSVVALLLDHSCETLIAILGVLKSGCAYLPLDPSHPPARIAFPLADAEAAMLITTQSLYERFGTCIAAHLTTQVPRIFSLDTEWHRCAALPANAPELPSLSSSTAAYLIYTSGSTGVPKGVVIEHSSLVIYISWAQSVYLKEGERADCALYSSLAFDLTVTSIFLPLVTGNTLHLYPQLDAGPPLLHVIEENRCHLLKLTPSHLALIRDLNNHQSQIHCLIVGGEALSTELAHAVSESFGHQVEIYNEYGPTEATVGCMIYRFDPENDKRTWVPIGRPAANTQIYVLDERLETTAEHATGELYIGGAGVARGYLGRAELTADRFVPDPFNNHPGARLYRTGDRARRLADGNIEYLGRNDEQVKYHGYRVELNELRLALSAHAKVRDAVVVVRKDGVREQLVGYYVGREAIDAKELRRHMQERVIAETAPQMYVHLRRLPLTLNGKVNIEALPMPWIEENGDGKKGNGEPRTPAETQLVAIWREVLGRERVRIDDNFFELGGHSLLATQVISRVHQCFHVELPLQMLFAAPTVAELAEHLNGMPQPKQDLLHTLPPIYAYTRDDNPMLSFAQKRLWFLQQMDTASTSYNIPSAVRLTGPLDVASLERTFSEIVRRHEVLRTTFALSGTEPVQIIGKPAVQTLPISDLSHLSASERLIETKRRIEDEAVLPFDLKRGPLLRVQLLRRSEEEHVLLVTMHHIVSDGWSIGVLIREVATLYAGYVRGKESSLQELPVQYADFAHWQREWLQGEVLEKQLDYWRAELDGAPEVIKLPIDRPRSKTTQNHSATHSFEISAGLTDELKRIGQERDATLFMVMHASFLSLLHYHTGEVDIVIGTDVANRNKIELEPLIGFFVNQLVLRVDVSGEPPFEALLARVREVSLGAYAHQNLPFDALVETLNPERSMLHSPVFQVKLVLQNTPLPPMELSGLTLELLEVEPETAKFDLMFTLREDVTGLKCRVEYSTGLFHATTITRMADGFVKILTHVVEHPTTRLSEISKLLADLDAQQQSMLQAEFKGMRRQKLKNLVPKPIVSSQSHPQSN